MFERVLLSASIVLFVSVSVLSNNETVPVAFGNVIVLSAVGSTTVKFVSNPSAIVDPSNLNEFTISTVVELIVVVVPLTVKLPVIL
jgi:hypothetical protein